jgi:hypothetical protein
MQATASGAKRPFDVSQVLTVKSPGYSLCYLLVGYAIYPLTRHLAVKVRLFIDFLVERFNAVRRRASAGQARWTLKTGQIKLAISPAGCTGCH